MNSVLDYELSKKNEAIDAALKTGDEIQTYSHDEVMNEAKDNFPQLKFK